MISVDTEDTGVDFWHGARPFFVSTCVEDGTQQFWCWDVDPLTRQPAIPAGDVAAIQAIIDRAASWSRKGPEFAERYALVGQNIKFDVHALATIGIHNWPWEATRDTLLAGHLLGSNLPHNLTDMAIQYLGRDIEPLEKRLEKAVQEGRRMVQQARLRVKRGSTETEYLAAWRIAGADEPDMPSAGDKTWKYDTWLPRALAQHLNYPTTHEWWTVLTDYALEDAAVTLALWGVMRAEIHRRGLDKLYAFKMESLPIIYALEDRGATYSLPRLEALRAEYEIETNTMRAECVATATAQGKELTMPKGSSNNSSLLQFVFTDLQLPILKYTETGRPSMDKEVVEHWRLILPKESAGGRFIRALRGARKRAKSLEFLDAYEKYGLAIDDSSDFYVLHYSLNPTGTTTTRLSCGNPNLQQVSKQETECEGCGGEGCAECGGTGEDLHSIRRVLGPAKGREWWKADAENIELRIPAYESGEPDLIALFEQPNEPPYYGSQHLLNFSVVYEELWESELQSVGLEKVGPHCKQKYASAQYQWCKNGDFAIQYQCGRDTADRSFHREGAFDLLKAKFNRLEALNQKWVRFANQHGYVETIPDRTVDPKRGYPLLCARGDWGSILTTVPLNYHTQGTAGWWMLKALIRCEAQLKEWRAKGFNGYTTLTVHDELVFDFPAATLSANGIPGNRWRMRKLKQLMEKGGEDLGIPTPVKVEYHPESWAKGIAI